jgi:hypothetical protein
MGLGKPWWKPSGSLLEYHLASTPLISPVWSPEERPTKKFSPYLWLKFAYYHRAIKHGLLVPHLVWWFSQLHPFTWGLPSGLPSSVVGHIYIYIYIYIWAIVKTLGSRKGHPQIWEGPIAYHTFVQ